MSDVAMNEIRKRADVLLVERGEFQSRARAQAAIEAGLVRINGEILRKASTLIETDARIEAEAPHPWVSRGGVKLAAALDAFKLDPSGLVCLDVGASTGGFTDVLLSRGARLVYAVDVGRDQIDPRLRADPRVVVHESLDARKIVREMFEAPPQAIVCDVSFISLRHVLPHVLPLAAESAWLAVLIKPQFEAGRDKVKKGAVKDVATQSEVCAAIIASVAALGWTSLGVVPSPIRGGDGAEEFLLGARHG
jgi:23S rRNA (cytidine1920-2'-O)/16S rRNA (cytidine1409-2'-O)-methyltransferase